MIALFGRGHFFCLQHCCDINRRFLLSAARNPESERTHPADQGAPAP
jgi:hypothetical protein